MDARFLGKDKEIKVQLRILHITKRFLMFVSDNNNHGALILWCAVIVKREKARGKKAHLCPYSHTDGVRGAFPIPKKYNPEKTPPQLEIPSDVNTRWRRSATRVKYSTSYIEMS